VSTSLNYLKGLPRTWLPLNVERGIKIASNSDLRRWLESGSVIINGEKPKPEDEITFPVTELIFFPNSKTRMTTIIKEVK